MQKMEKELSNDFRRLASLYAGKAGFSWETYGKLEMIYTYHEYAVSAYFSCRDLYSVYLSVTAAVEHTNDPRWIMAENDYHAAIFGLYSSGGIVLDIMRNLNSCIGSL
jgi:hypothetical protein